MYVWPTIPAADRREPSPVAMKSAAGRLCFIGKLLIMTNDMKNTMKISTNPNAPSVTVLEYVNQSAG